MTATECVRKGKLSSCYSLVCLLLLCVYLIVCFVVLKMSDTEKGEASDVKPRIPPDPLEVELRAQEEKLRQQARAVETLKAEPKKKEEAAQKEARGNCSLQM